jgi:hypothetical protein
MPTRSNPTKECKIMNEDTPLQRRHSFYRFVRSYGGIGQIYLDSGTLINCEFECGQTEEGGVIVCSRQIERFSNLPDQVGFVWRLSGYTSTGQLISVDNLSLLHAEYSSNPFISFYARDMTVSTASSTSLASLKFYIVNFEFIIPLRWRFRGYCIAIRKIKGNDEVEIEMETTKIAKITAEIEVKPENGFINDISEVEILVNDLCNLLSLAKGCMIHWLYWDAYSSSDFPVKSYHLNAVISRYTNFYVILKHPPKDIEDFVQQVYTRYQDIQKGDIWKFDDAIIHYANTLASGSFTELKSLNLVSLIEYLTGRFVEHEKTNKVFEDASFSDDKKKVLQKGIKNLLISQFSEEDLVKNEYVSAIKKHSKKGTIKQVSNDMASIAVEGLNRRGFPWSLNRLLYNLGLVTRENEVELFIKIRNKLVHEARYLNEEEFEKIGLPYEDKTRQFFRIISFTSRIMLAILKYRGFYHDWHLFKGAEWAGAETARVEMQYR